MAAAYKEKTEAGSAKQLQGPDAFRNLEAKLRTRAEPLLMEIKTDQEVRKALLDLLKQPEKTSQTLISVLGDQKVRNTLVDFALTKEGKEFFLEIAKKTEGVAVFFQVGVTKEGSAAAAQLMTHPTGWKNVVVPTMLKMKDTVFGDFEYQNEGKVELKYLKNVKTVGEMVKLLRDDKIKYDVYKELSATDETTKLAIEVLNSKEGSKALFDVTVSDIGRMNRAFEGILVYKERADRIKKMFVSEGGRELNIKLAGDKTGKTLMYMLGMTAPGVDIGQYVLTHDPVQALKIASKLAELHPLTMTSQIAKEAVRTLFKKQ
jgi:hypothetical protein